MSKLEKSLVGIQKIREAMPDQVNAYLNFTQKVKASGVMHEKDKALVLVALAVFAQCEMCIESNVTAAIEAGAVATNKNFIDSKSIKPSDSIEDPFSKVSNKSIENNTKCGKDNLLWIGFILLLVYILIRDIGITLN